MLTYNVKIIEIHVFEITELNIRCSSVFKRIYHWTGRQILYHYATLVSGDGLQSRDLGLISM